MATQFDKKRAEVLERYLKAFPLEGNAPLSRAIFKKHKRMFDSVEQVRCMVRYRRGAMGTKDLPKDKSHTKPFELPAE